MNSKSNNVLDQFPQFASLSVLGAATTTGAVVQQLQTGLTNQQKLAWEVSRMELVLPEPWFSSFQGVGDVIMAGLTQSNSLTQQFNLLGASVIDLFAIFQGQTPFAESGGQVMHAPFIREYREPRLVLPQMLFMFLVWDTSTGGTAISALSASMRIWYREREITKEDWYDLLQLRLPLGAS